MTKMTTLTKTTAMQRILHEPKWYEHLVWWLCRACFIYGFICTIAWQFPNPPAWSLAIGRPDQVDATKLLLMMIIYLPVCFLWEIFQFLPAKNIFRFFPRYFQYASCIFAVCTGFMGAFVNFYYTQWWWDMALHTLGGGLCVIMGYEICAAMQRKYKFYLPMGIIFWVAIGMCCFVGTVWELFEFTFDQGFGGDTQHWSLELAQGAGVVRPFFQPAKEPGVQWDMRFALMDTMDDIVANSVGGAVFAVFLKIFPYHHRGQNNPNVLYRKNTLPNEK